MSENKVLRRIFGPKGQEVTRSSKNLYIEELHNLYDSHNANRVINSKKIRWVGHVARIGR
jgi:hypothetical protein